MSNCSFEFLGSLILSAFLLNLSFFFVMNRMSDTKISYKTGVILSFLTSFLFLFSNLFSNAFFKAIFSFAFFTLIIYHL
jgi:hypothetical protein